MAGSGPDATGRATGGGEPDPRAPTVRFTNRAEDYARFRPGYPAGALDKILEGLGPPERVRAADVGAGTGISARALAGRGVSVTAIEPNEAMRSAAPHDPKVVWHQGTSEATGLAAGSLDLVLCAQSFHWFDAKKALAEFRRILRPGGRVALMWNEGSPNDPATVGYYALTRRYAMEPSPVASKSPPGDALRAAGLENVRTEVVPGGQALDMEGLLGRARSSSYLPRTGPAYESFAAELRALHAKFARPDGTIFIVYWAWIHMAESPKGNAGPTRT